MECEKYSESLSLALHRRKGSDPNTGRPEPQLAAGRAADNGAGFSTTAEAVRNSGSHQQHHNTQVGRLAGPAVVFGNASDTLTGAARELCRQTDSRGFSRTIPIPMPKRR
jgi:hypothetical protein